MTESSDGLKKHWRVFYGLDGIIENNNKIHIPYICMSLKSLYKMKVLPFNYSYLNLYWCDIPPNFSMTAANKPVLFTSPKFTFASPILINENTQLHL